MVSTLRPVAWRQANLTTKLGGWDNDVCDSGKAGTSTPVARALGPASEIQDRLRALGLDRRGPFVAAYHAGLSQPPRRVPGYQDLSCRH